MEGLGQLKNAMESIKPIGVRGLLIGTIGLYSNLQETSVSSEEDNVSRVQEGGGFFEH
jgi:hypothetical protein